MKGVLYISYDGLTDPLGQSQILPYVQGLCEKGYSFHILSFEKPDRFREGQRRIEKALDGFDIKWHPHVYHKNPPVLSTVMDMVKMRQEAHKICLRHRIAIVHCRSYLAGLIGMHLKRKLGVKFLFDIRGFWADERLDGGIWSLSHPLYRQIYFFFKRKEVEMMKHADHIISLTHSGKEEIVSGKLFQGRSEGIPPEQVTVIPCAVDLELFDPSKIKPEAKEALKQQLALDGVRDVVIYLGSLGTWYLIDEMLAYFQRYQEENPSSIFLIVTKDDPEIIWRSANKIGLSETAIKITQAERTEVPLYLSIASFGLFFIKPAYSKKASSAVKMGEMLAMGLPIVTNKGVGDADVYIDQKKLVHLENVELKRPQTIDFPDEYSLTECVSKYFRCYAILTV